MTTSFLNKSKIQIALFLCSIFLTTACGSNDSEYQYISNRTDDLHIVKGSKVVVPSTMVDFIELEAYIIGLRLPADYFNCNQGQGYKIRLLNTPEYFVLSKSNDKLTTFKLKENFLKSISQLNLQADINLDYTKFTSIWAKYSEHYKNVDYSGCVKQ